MVSVGHLRLRRCGNASTLENASRCRSSRARRPRLSVINYELSITRRVQMRPTTLVPRRWSNLAANGSLLLALPRVPSAFLHPASSQKSFLHPRSRTGRPGERASVTRASKNHARVNQSPVVCILRSISEPAGARRGHRCRRGGFRKRSRGPVAAEFKRVFARRTQGSVDANDWCARKWNKTPRDKETPSSRAAPSRFHSLCER